MGEAVNAILPEEQFHLDRTTGIGGSDAAAALGLSERRTALDVYLMKRGQATPFVDNDATLWGRLLEPVVRQYYSEKTGRTVVQPRDMRRSKQHPFMIGHPDGLVMEGRVYEGKTARTDRGWGEPGSDEIPQDYVLQVQHYMIIEGVPVADVAVLIGGQDFRLYEVPADRELQQMIIEAERDLWTRITAGNPPDPDWEHAHTATALRKLYPGTDGSTIKASESDLAWRRVMVEAAERASIYDKQAETAKAHLMWRMEQAAILDFGDGKCLRRKEVKRKGYVVEDTTYVDARIANLKEKA